MMSGQNSVSAGQSSPDSLPGDREPPHWDHRAVAGLVYTGVVFGLLQLGPLTRPINSFLHGPDSPEPPGQAASLVAVQFLVALLVWMDLIYTREIKERRHALLVWLLAGLYLALYGVVPWVVTRVDSWARAVPHLLLTAIGGVFAVFPSYCSQDADRSQGLDRSLAVGFTVVSTVLLLIALIVPGASLCTLLLASFLGLVCYVCLFVHLHVAWQRWRARHPQKRPGKTTGTT
jgi:hypothetical protein